MSWIKTKDAMPREEGQYLIVIDIGYTEPLLSYDVARWSNNLHNVDEYDFAENKPGFYGYDSEWGYFEQDDVMAWMPVPKYEMEERCE